MRMDGDGCLLPAMWGQHPSAQQESMLGALALCCWCRARRQVLSAEALKQAHLEKQFQGALNHLSGCRLGAGFYEIGPERSRRCQNSLL